MVYILGVRNEWGFEPKRSWEGKKEPARKIPALSPANDGGPSGDGYYAGLPVDGTNFPKWVRWADKRRKPTPDFDDTPFLSVSEKAKQVIESLEPGVHQFFPVEYQNTKGEFTSIRYWFVPCNRVDSVHRELSNMVLLDGLEWTTAKNVARFGKPVPSHIDPNEPARLVFSLSAIGNHHIWRDKHISSCCYISDAMANRFRQEKLTGIELDRSKQEAA